MASLLQVPAAAINDFCSRWKVCELSLFGSALRDDFSLRSDVDLLVRFDPGARWDLLDWVRMERELAGLVGRRVDLVSREAVEGSHNWIRRGEILSTARTIYAA